MIRSMGGFFISDDAGKTWRQSNRGLDERDILSLQQAESGVLFVGHQSWHLLVGLAQRFLGARENDFRTGTGVATQATGTDTSGRKAESHQDDGRYPPQDGSVKAKDPA